jgi:hypothetical protein
MTLKSAAAFEINKWAYVSRLRLWEILHTAAPSLRRLAFGIFKVLLWCVSVVFVCTYKRRSNNRPQNAA